MVETTIINLFNFHKYPAEPNPNFHKITFGERQGTPMNSLTLAT